MIKGSIHQEFITVVNMCPTLKAPKYIKHILKSERRERE